MDEAIQERRRALFNEMGLPDDILIGYAAKPLSEDCVRELNKCFRRMRRKAKAVVLATRREAFDWAVNPSLCVWA